MFLSKRARRVTAKTASPWDDVGLDLIDGLRTFVIFMCVFFVSSRALEPTPATHKALMIVLVASLTFQFAMWGLYLIRTWNARVMKARMATDPSSASALNLMATMLQALLVIVLVLIGLSNLGVDIGALVAGLGVGGIAVALAAQNILGDLLSSLSIVLDKPFVVGDFITTNDEAGTVEYIGIKTTRVRSLSGEEVVLSNKSLLESRIHNYKKLYVRRIVQTFRVGFDVTPDLLEQIPKWVRQIVEGEPVLKFDRCHLAKFGESAYEFELVFLVNSPEYNVYMDLQQNVLLAILRKFKENDVDMGLITRQIRVTNVDDANEAEKPIPPQVFGNA